MFLAQKNKKIRSVVNKVGTISNEYRVFDMEVIAGDSDLKTEVVRFVSSACRNII